MLLGLGIVAYIFYRDDQFTAGTFKLALHARPGPFLVALAVILMRDLGYMYRIRTLTEKRLSWTRAFYVIILWEFASAVTPSVVGGTAIAVFILIMEGLSPGRSTAYVMLTAIMDNGFFILFAPIVLIFAGMDVFPMVTIKEWDMNLETIFWVSYGLFALYLFLFLYALFINPKGFKRLLLRITSGRATRKWRRGAYSFGKDMWQASHQLRGKQKRYWFKIIGSTVFVWFARYLMLNSLISSYVKIDWLDHLDIFGSQIIMWVIMVISPTPGSSGTAEYFFIEFFNKYLGDYTALTSVIWRMLSYYPYLVLGAIFLPKWVRQRMIANRRRLREIKSRN